MNTDRIDHLIDTKKLKKKKAGITGLGGGANLARNLVRCGLAQCVLCDRDKIESPNVCRQEHMSDHVGMFKVDSLAAELQRINPCAQMLLHGHLVSFGGVDAQTLPVDFCGLTHAEIDKYFGDCDVLIAATDSHAAQARMNVTALRLNIPAVFIGLYPSGQAGEVAWWRPGMPSCYRCLVPSRYEAHADGPRGHVNAGDIFSLQIVDGIAGAIALGLLTAGSDNRYGRLIEQLGDRQFLQIKLDPAWGWNGRDIIREELGIAADNPNYFSFCTIARKDPDPGGQCPDCLQYRKPRVEIVA